MSCKRDETAARSVTAVLAAATIVAGCGGGSGARESGVPPLRTAEAAVRARGYFPVDTSGYEKGAALAAIVGVRKGSADATAQRAFFFAGAGLAGTDTRSDSAGIRIAFSRPPVIALRYELFNPRDPQCCPSAGSATVRYRWNGDRLVPLDRAPPSSYSAPRSRR
jgi:LppP/LprE lipoprotein